VRKGAPGRAWRSREPSTLPGIFSLYGDEAMTALSPGYKCDVNLVAAPDTCSGTAAPKPTPKSLHRGHANHRSELRVCCPKENGASHDEKLFGFETGVRK